MVKLKELNKLKAYPERSRREIFSSIIFYLAILFFIIGFNFSDNRAGGWYQQFMPNLGGRQITDITFLDSLTGYAVINNLSPGDTGYILKTTNRGDNWNFSFTVNRGFTAIDFINANTGFACGGSGGGTTYLCKTTNGGLNWFLVSTPSAAKWQDMSVLNNDTIWLVDDDALTGGVYRTTNGGASWQQQGFFSSQNPDKIYMFNARLGFIARNNNVRRTTNGGTNWTPLTGVDGFRDMYFADSLTGWKANINMKKTTDGGLNWVEQITPQGGIIQSSFIYRFSNVNRDTIWGVGGYVLYPNNQIRGLLHRTTNGGTNWLFQIPDTSIHIGSYGFCDFVNNLTGWAYVGIHTITGGNDTFYTSVKQISLIVPDEFKLFQNYPNPFNPSTKIKASLTPSKGEKQNVKLIVYDITGKEISVLLDEQLSAGSYEITFDGTNYSSGIYFYSLIVDGKLIDTKKMIMIK